MLGKVVLLVCVGLGAAQMMPLFHGDQGPLVINMNDSADDLIPKISRVMRSRGYDNLLMPDLGVEGAPVFFGIMLHGASAISRSGNVTATPTSPEAMTIDATIRMHNPVYSVYWAAGMGNVTWIIDYVDFQINFGVLSAPKGYPVSCFIDTNFVKILKVGKITQHSSSPEFDGVPPQKEILDFIVKTNNRIFGDKQIINKVNYFGSTFCEIPFPDVTN